MNSLIIYFSRKDENYYGGGLKDLQKGNTEVVAETIAKTLNADLFEVQPVKNYDKGYYKCCDEAKAELKANARPEIKKTLKDISKYDVIFIGYPIWWGTIPMCMFTQLEQLDFSNKVVAPFCTHEGSGLGNSERDVKRVCKNAKVLPGLAIQGSRASSSEAQISTWAKEIIKK